MSSGRVWKTGCGIGDTGSRGENRRGARRRIEAYSANLIIHFFYKVGGCIMVLGLVCGVVLRNSRKGGEKDGKNQEHRTVY